VEMLKIRDEVDLKNRKYCYVSDDEFDQIWSFKNVLFDKDTRIIFPNQFFNDLGEKRLDDLYDLIKADLVEKV
jgi:hypothetical protein